MTWRLFIDDERFPADGEDDMVIARDVGDVIRAIARLGSLPRFVSFDHDLGPNQPSGFDIAKILVEYDLNGKVRFPEDFSYYVHSQNPVGKANIEGYLGQYLELRTQGTQND